MDGQKDAATRQYEREIRIGMSLLGVLALAFVGVLARRVWMENSQFSTSPKKPIYLSRAERDALRARTKALPLYSVHASSPRRRLAAAGNPVSEREAEAALVPDLEIEELDAPVSPAAALIESPPPRHREPEAMPEEPAAGAKRLTAPSEQAATAPPTTSMPPREGEAEPNEELEPAKPSRFSSEESSTTEPLTEAPTETEPAEAEPSEITPDEAPPPSPIKPRPLGDAPQSESSKEEAPTEAADAPGAAEESPAPEPEVVRKKTLENPWKRKAVANASPAGGERYKVVRGDTLKSIAQKQLGDSGRWKDIYDLNRAEIGDDFSYLRSGLLLRLPPSEEPPPAADDPQAARVQEPPSP